MKKVIFVNLFHNGDIHCSREFIKHFKSVYTGEVSYCHFNDKKTTQDLNINYIHPSSFGFSVDSSTIPFIEEREDSILVNTWVGADDRKYLYMHGCTLDTNYVLWTDIYARLSKMLNINITINDKQSYIPTLDYSIINKSPIDDFFASTGNKHNIFIVTSNVCSGQSHNFDFKPIVEYLAMRFPEKNFIISNEMNTHFNNIIYAKNISRTSDKCDLIENSYISTKCNAIIGRGSGSFCYSIVKENYLSNKRIIGIGHKPEEIFWAKPQNGIFFASSESRNLPNLLNEELKWIR